MSERLTADISADLRAFAQDMRAEHRNTDAVLLAQAADKLDGLIALLAEAETERDRLALDLQARDIAVREADRLREQVEAERDRAVLALGDLRGREALLVAERDDARESAASILNDAGALAETVRRYEPVIEAAKAWLAYGWNTLAGDPAERLSAAIEALGDIPSSQLPEVGEPGSTVGDSAQPPDIPSPTAPKRKPWPPSGYLCLMRGNNCPGHPSKWMTCPAEPEGTPDADA
jgi:hypothetical protein